MNSHYIWNLRVDLDQLQLTLKLSDNTIWHIIYINEINIENKSKTYVEIYSKIN
jgi:hypothetical protein